MLEHPLCFPTRGCSGANSPVLKASKTEVTLLQGSLESSTQTDVVGPVIFYWSFLMFWWLFYLYSGWVNPETHVDQLLWFSPQVYSALLNGPTADSSFSAQRLTETFVFVYQSVCHRWICLFYQFELWEVVKSQFSQSCNVKYTRNIPNCCFDYGNLMLLLHTCQS